MWRWAVACGLVACGSDPQGHEPVFGEPIQVVPGPGLPADVTPQTANNNLDVVRHGGRVYLAFRTGPSHWASPDVVMYVVSSVDQEHWDFETSFALGTDLREPRFLSLGDELLLYFAVLGTDSLDFEPQQMMVSARAASGEWSTPVGVYESSFIPWRARVVGGKPYVIGYTGGENIYDADGEPVRIHFLTTTDGRTFSPAVGDTPVVLEGGGSETDFTFLKDGSLVAVVRNEEGDADGFGSKICRAPKENLGAWTCKPDKKKYDSPLVFRRDDDVWLIGRRNISDTGDFDLGKEGPMRGLYLAYQGDYWLRPKRCSLWRVDPESQSVSYVVDLPSRGDTCFASVLDEGDHYTVYNYTSPLDGEDLP